ncbi:hypothetical protein M378DRAFT_361973 [Amanita muscaria Koide BX008]|uniref:Uncharacterized protein n=1 Tax=Amanita muscaria (strain Koide BX008) TaxID=946122 RepID=A0A0C2WNF1_AMAMK|nr:hypothetical protein M378DRAFT_361973 [Amanita muscaria Koide BX008]
MFTAYLFSTAPDKPCYELRNSTNEILYNLTALVNRHRSRIKRVTYNVNVNADFVSRQLLLNEDLGRSITREPTTKNVTWHSCNCGQRRDTNVAYYGRFGYGSYLNVD